MDTFHGKSYHERSSSAETEWVNSMLWIQQFIPVTPSVSRSSAYRVASTCEWQLRRGHKFSLTPTDANVFIESYFPGEYTYHDNSGLSLLQRAQLFAERPKTKAEIRTQPVLRSIHVMSLPQRVDELVTINTAPFDNYTLRISYPALLKKKDYLLLEFLTNNDMALKLYGYSLESDTYGRLKLKLMGCVVAFLQDLHNMVNVDAVL